MENNMAVPQKKRKQNQQYDPAIPFLGIFPKEVKAGSQRGICTPMFIAALFTVAKIWKLQSIHR